MYMQIKVEGNKHWALYDPGATQSCISEELFLKIQPKTVLQKISENFWTADGRQIQILGQIKIKN